MIQSSHLAIDQKMRSWITSKGNRIIKLAGGRSNVFLLTNCHQNILIDTGPASVWKTVEKRLTESDVNQIDCLILTHTHYDHAENAWRIREKYGARVIVHKNEAGYLTSGENILPRGTLFISKLIITIFGRSFKSLARYKPCQYDYEVESFFNLDDFGFDAFIIHTPGHTTGSMSVVIDNEIAVVGDAMFGVFKGSIFPPFAEDPKQMIESWDKLLETGCKIFLPSHGSENSRDLVKKEYERRLTSA
jgi:hydroxyacylglutathione hydrolase